MSRDEREIERARRSGESRLGEWLLLRPNRFSPERSTHGVLVLGVASVVLLLPVGPLAVIHAVRCNDQRRAAGLRTSWMATVGGALGVVGTILLIVVLWRWVA